MLILTTPWCPSVNHYWIASGKRRFISRRGTQYRQDVQSLVPEGTETLTGRVKVHIYAYPPDRRKRDLDNLLKASLDSLAHAGVYKDDAQIDFLSIERMEVVKGGKLEITIQELD